MSEQAQQTRQEFEKQLVLKAWKDPKFKEKLLKDPKSAVQDSLSVLDKKFQLPADLAVKVVEEDSKTLYIVLPQHPQEAAKGVDFTDKQVEDAAGGSIVVVAVNSVVNQVNVVTVDYNMVQAIYNVNVNVNAQYIAAVNVNIC